MPGPFSCSFLNKPAHPDITQFPKNGTKREVVCSRNTFGITWRLAFLVIPVSSFYEQKSDTFSAPDSMLLFARPYYDVRILTPDHSLVIPPPVDVPANSGLFNYPSISQRGDVIAWGFAVQGHPRLTLLLARRIHSC